MMDETAGDRRRWLVVFLLCAIAVASFLDRYIVSVIAEPLIADLKIDATAVGLLIGVGFGLVYSTVGLPVSYLLDRGNRVRIVAVGIMVWGLATIGSGLASDFPTLLVTRFGVAIGEAALVPATVSLIADLFPPHRRGLPIALFMSVSALMGSGAFVLGAWAYQAALTLEPMTGLAAWRTTFILVGLPSVVLGLVWWAVMREPPRTQTQGAPGEDASLGAVVRHLRGRWRFYLPFYLTFGLSAIGSYSFISWTSTMLVRSFHLTVADASYYFGVVGLAAAAAGAIVWPMTGSQVLKSGRRWVNIALLGTGLVLGHCGIVLLWLVDDPAPAIATTLLSTFGFAAGGGLAVLIVQDAAPPAMRAKLTSCYMLMGNLVGLTCGPPFSAWLSEHVFSGPDGLRQSMVAISACSVPVIAVLILAAARAMRRLPVVTQSPADL